MWHLIKKDWLIQKRNVKLSLLLMLFFSFTLSKLGEAGLPVGIAAITYVLVLGASMLEEKNNAERMLVSLPIPKRTIVLSKYVSIFGFAAFAAAGFWIINRLAVWLDLSFMNLPVTAEGLLTSAVLVAFFGGISFPLLFRFGYAKSRIANFILFFLFIFGGTAVKDVLLSDEYSGWLERMLQRLSGASDALVWAVVFAFMAMFVAGSYAASLTLFKRKEF